MMEAIVPAEKVANMNHLFRAAVRAIRSYLEFWDGPTPDRFKEMQEDVASLGKALARVNHGKDPVGFISRYAALYEVATMPEKKGGAK